MILIKQIKRYLTEKIDGWIYKTLIAKLNSITPDIFTEDYTNNIIDRLGI